MMGAEVDSRAGRTGERVRGTTRATIATVMAALAIAAGATGVPGGADARPAAHPTATLVTHAPSQAAGRHARVIRALRAENRRLRARVAMLRDDNAALREAVGELRAELARRAALMRDVLEREAA